MDYGEASSAVLYSPRRSSFSRLATGAGPPEFRPALSVLLNLPLVWFRKAVHLLLLSGQDQHGVMFLVIWRASPRIAGPWRI
jgi:hypothetical protein